MYLIWLNWFSNIPDLPADKLPSPSPPLPIIKPVPIPQPPIQPVVQPIIIPPIKPLQVTKTILAPLADLIDDGEITVDEAKYKFIAGLTSLIGADASQVVLSSLRPVTCPDPENYSYNTLKNMQFINPDEYRKLVLCNAVINAYIIWVAAKYFSNNIPKSLADLQMFLMDLQSKLVTKFNLPVQMMYGNNGNYYGLKNMNPYYKNQ
jgi:hypothetical protein